MDINIKLEAFEGPFDLLYHLIEKNQINIYDIPIAKLTDQYLKYIDKIDNKSLESISQFLVMAATLIEIKSKMLLPEFNEDDNKQQQDPREELVNRLLEYKKFKELSIQLDNIQSETSRIFFKKSEIDIDKIKKENEFNLSDMLIGITLVDILIAFEEVMKRKEKKIDKIRSKFGVITKDLYTIEEKHTYLLELLKLFKEINFKDIFKSNSNKMEIVVTFLALLELIKMRKIIIYQNGIFNDIIIKNYN